MHSFDCFYYIGGGTIIENDKKSENFKELCEVMKKFNKSMLHFVEQSFIFHTE